MKNILTIGHTDLRIFFKDRTSLVWIFLVPLAFIYFTSFSSRPQGEPQDTKPRVLINNLDTGFLSELFLEELGQQGLNVMTEDPEKKAKRGITIPENFTQEILNKNEVEMDFFQVSDSTNQNLRNDLVEINLIRAVFAFNGYLIEHATYRGQKEITESSLRKIIKKENPVSLDSYFAGKNPIPVGFNQSLPGIMIMYLLMNLLIFGGSNIAASRRSGGLRRISINPVSNAEIIMGKMYGLMLLAIVQIIFFLLFGQFIFHVNIGENLFGILVTLLIFSWVATSIGMMIGFLIKSEDKVVGLGIMITLPLAALGGCWWPMEIVPDTFRMIAHITPTAWAMDCLHALITFGADFKDILKPLGVLAIFGSVANILSAKFYRI